jgi:hypothetical protein
MAAVYGRHDTKLPASHGPLHAVHGTLRFTAFGRIGQRVRLHCHYCRTASLQQLGSAEDVCIVIAASRTVCVGNTNARRDA